MKNKSKDMSRDVSRDIKKDIRILDCTLRDGGYINDWNWGYETARSIINLLIRANINVIEVGFLRNVDNYDKDITVCNDINELNRLLPENYDGNAVFSAMAMRSNYDVSKLREYSGDGISLIRITAHDYDIEEGMSFAREVKNRGYMLSINPINIMGYSDSRLLWIIEKVNSIKPEQFAIVDTFGSMRRRDLDRIVSIVDHNLEKDIGLALHLHENMSLSCSLAQLFLEKHLDRPISIDGSLMGMGRVPGNLPIELISFHLNEYYNMQYDIEYLLDAIQEHIYPIREKKKWGYDPVYFLSARFNLHRNYAEFYSKKGDLTTRDIDVILSGFSREKCTVFDRDYAEKKYVEYKNNNIDDIGDISGLKALVKNRQVLLLLPGESVKRCEAKISEFIKIHDPFVISVNFVPDVFPVDMAFFGNNQRYSRFRDNKCRKIVVSSIKENTAEYVINYNRLTDERGDHVNSFIMSLRLLDILDVKQANVAGADGIRDGEMKFFDNSIHSVHKPEENFNARMHDIICDIGIEVNYVTPSPY